MQITRRKFQTSDEFIFQVCFTHLRRQLDGTTGILHDLRCFDSRNFVEEPSTTGVHQHGISLNLHQAENTLGFNINTTMITQKLLYCRIISVQNHINVILASLPWIFQNSRRLFLENFSQLISEPVERLTQRSSPPLIPGWLTSGITAAIL